MNEQLDNECATLWSKCLAFIEDNVAPNMFKTWFIPIKPVSWDATEHLLKLQVPSPFFQEFIEGNFSDLLKMALTRVYGKDVRLKYQAILVQQTAMQNNPVVIEESSFKVDADDARQRLPFNFDPFAVQSRSTVESQLNPIYTLDNFIEGTCNKLAKSAGEAIAKNPGKNTPFNPLFIFAGSGMGKTHLENAIGNKIKAEHPEKNVIYVSALKFQTQFQDATKNNNVTEFINFYQMLDVLIIDDIQELAGKTGTQNTFFHIFNALHQAGKQLVLACDRAPQLVQGLEQRLTSRFKWGLTVELSTPDAETRKQILKNKIEKDELDISEDIIDFIAQNVSGTVRDLEGVVNSLLAHATLTDATINMDLAKQVVGKNVSHDEKKISIHDIQKVVCDYYNLETDDIQTKSRKREVVQARQIAMYLARKLTKNSLATIGAEIGNRDHATVLHACKTVEDLIEIDKTIRTSVSAIEDQLK